MDPSAVTIQDSREIAPTWAMLVGSMMMPEPIMLTATMNVSCTTFIFLAAVPAVAALTSPPDRGGVELDAVIDPLLIDALVAWVHDHTPTSLPTRCGREARRDWDS